MVIDPSWRALRAFAFALVLGVATLGLAACDNPGPAEEAGGDAGAAVDDAVDSAGEAMEDAGEAVQDAVD